jgi:MFS family permease
MDPLQKKAVAVTTAAHALVHSFMLVFPAVRSYIEKDFSLAVGALYTTYFVSRLFFGAGAITAGPLADFLSPKKVLLIYLIGAGTSSIAAALATGQTSLLVSFIFLGYFCSLYHTAGVKLVTKQEEKRGTSLAYHGTGGNLGLAASPGVSALLAHFLGWPAAYLFFGVAAIAVALWLMRMRVEVHRDEDRHGTIEGRRHVDVHALAFLLVPYALLGFCYTGFITFMPRYFEVLPQMPKGKATLFSGAIMSGLYLVGSLGQFWGGAKANKGSLEKHWLILLVIVLPFLVLLTVAGTWVVVLVVCGAAFPFIFFASQPITNSLMAKYSSYRWRGRILSLGFFFSFGLGSLAAQVGKKAASAGRLDIVFGYLSGAVLVAIVISVFLLRFVRRRATDLNEQA